MLALVTGTGRSGTTLVQETLARHPAAGFISGLDDKLPRLNLSGRYNGKIYRWIPQRDSRMRALRESTKLLEKGRLRVAPSEAYKLIDRHVFAGFSTPCRDLLAEDMTPYLQPRVQAFFDTRVRNQGCDVLLQHLTGWPRTGFLRAAVPDLRVIHVVRDGRAVASSWLQMGWWDGWRGPDNWFLGPLDSDLRQEWEESGQSFPVLAALGWKMLMAAFENAEAQCPPDRWLNVRYEDVLADPRTAFANMLDFLGLEWTDSFEAGFARHVIQSDRSAAFRDELTPSQLAAVEAVLEKPLTRWGYSPV
ncbi:MAG: sulfotransferase family protein [Propionicimonas sp.]